MPFDDAVGDPVGEYQEVIRRFKVLHLAPVLAIVALLAWAFASPIAAGPDDDFHLVSTWCADSSTYCETADADDERVVPSALLELNCFAQQEFTSASCQDAVDMSSEPDTVTDRGNFANSYPPVYYAVMGLFAGPNIIASALLMRVINVVLFVGLTTATFVLLPVARRATLTWMWLAATIPMGLFLFASNNPSGWAVMGVGTAWIALLGYLETAGRRKWALGSLFAVSAVMAAGSRGDAAMYTIIAIGAVFLLTVPVTAAERAGGAVVSYLKNAILPAVIAVVCMLLFFSSRQTSSGLGGFSGPTTPVGGEGIVIDPVTEGLGGLSLFAYNMLNIPFLWMGNFGEWGLGWLDTSMPSIVTFATIAVLTVVVFKAFGQMWGRKALVVGLVGAVMWLLPAYVLQQGGNLVGEQVQPRYVLPVIVLFIGVALMTRGGAALRFTRPQLVVLGVSLSGAFFLALHFNLRRYITGADLQSFNLGAGMEWWWDTAVSPNVVWIVGWLAYTALVAILLRELWPATAAEQVAEAPESAVEPVSV